jgi:hypothetical protein
MQPNNNRVLRYKGNIRCRTTQNRRVKVILIARPLLTQVAQKFRRYKHGVFTSKTCFSSFSNVTPHRNLLFLFVKHLATRIHSNILTGNKISGHRKCFRQETCPASGSVDRWRQSAMSKKHKKDRCRTLEKLSPQSVKCMLGVAFLRHDLATLLRQTSVCECVPKKVFTPTIHETWWNGNTILNRLLPAVVQKRFTKSYETHWNMWMLVCCEVVL